MTERVNRGRNRLYESIAADHFDSKSANESFFDEI